MTTDRNTQETRQGYRTPDQLIACAECGEMHYQTNAHQVCTLCWSMSSLRQAIAPQGGSRA